MSAKKADAVSFVSGVFVCMLLLVGIQQMVYAQQPPGPVNCKPRSQKTGETGCWILASEPVGALTGSVYWTIDVYSTKELAEHAKGSHSTVVESLGKVWLFTVGEKQKADPAGDRVAEVGPLPIQSGPTYSAQYMEATLQPGMVSRTHVHSGLEVFYTESGETCLETPDGKQLGKRGVNIVIPGGVSMELTATGTEVRRGIMLILHDASKPPTTLVDTWKSKGLCASAK
jgi:quercetin dioxygenase-like cupin family protein